MLAAVLAFTVGCGAQKAVVEYDEATVEQFSEWMIQFCAGTDEASAEQLKQMREFTFEQQLAQMNLPVTPENLLQAVDSWHAGEKECGAFVSHGEFSYKATASELHITTEAEFAKRDATIEIVLDDELYLDSITVGAHMSTGEILKKAGLNTLLGMGTVFVVLIIISLIISLFKYIPDIQEKFKKKQTQQTAAPAEVSAESVAAVSGEDSAQMDDTELIAVIAAAIAAAEGTTTDGFVVRSIKRRKSNRW